MRVIIVQTGLANVASVQAAFERLGCEVKVTDDPSNVADAERLVLPGVGSFGAGMDTLMRRELATVLRRRIEAGAPTLAICLGMQLLATCSDESPGVQGLACLPASVSAFPKTVDTPQFGWNRIVPEPGGLLTEPGYVYFANSYRFTEAPEGWTASWATYGDRFCASLQRGAVLACQFHPELSGAYGAELLNRWLRQEAVPC